MIMKESNSELLVLAKAKDATAQRQLYEHHAPMVLGTCRRYCSNHADAEDVMQETFVKAFRKLNTFKSDGDFGAWIRRIAVNTSIDHVRKRGRLQLDSQAAAALAQGTDPLPAQLRVAPSVLEQMAVEEIIALIDKLPEGFRFVFNLVAVEGYSHKEVASLLGISESASRSQLTRARKWLICRLATILVTCL